MPTMRTPISRFVHDDEPGWLVALLLTGERYAAGEAGDIEAAAATEATLREAWSRLRGELLPAWQREHPGSRPWAWWMYDAPRAEGGRWAERLRLGGAGEAFRDSCAPVYNDPGSAGLPVSFDPDTLDPMNPPRFESEAAFLARHKVLSPGERRRVPAGAFAPVRLRVVEDRGELAVELPDEAA